MTIPHWLRYMHALTNCLGPPHTNRQGPTRRFEIQHCQISPDKPRFCHRLVWIHCTLANKTVKIFCRATKNRLVFGSLKKIIIVMRFGYLIFISTDFDNFTSVYVYSMVFVSIEKIYQTLETVFHTLSNHLVFCQKYSAASLIINSPLSVGTSWWSSDSHVWCIISCTDFNLCVQFYWSTF